MVPARKVKLAEAVDTAMDWWTMGGTPVMDRPGGSSFDREIRRRCRSFND